MGTSLEVVILAAGKGKRMHSDLPKVLHPVGGRPMLWHVIQIALDLHPTRIHVVVGHDGQKVRDALESQLPTMTPPLNWITQTEQLGTGHAVLQALPHMDGQSRCLVLYGDVPLVNPDDLKYLCQAESDLALLTAYPADPTGLGRILRDDSGSMKGIVEHRDADERQRAIREVNTGIMRCGTVLLDRWLRNLSRENSQGEYYLTDIVGLAVAEGVNVFGGSVQDSARFLGVNSRAELAAAERSFQKLVALRLMEDGVTLMDPARLDVRGEVRFGRDCVVDVNVVLEGQVEVGDGVTIEPGCILRNTRIGNHCHVLSHSVLDDAVLGENCKVGPFARIRPGTLLADDVRVGNFVEIKNSRIADGAKVNHLSYVGDSRVGRDTNVGAGVITCNYDGANKHETVIGDDVFVGSGSQLVAPVRIADGVTIGSGSTVTRNVEQPGLVVSRTRQQFYASWKRPRKKTE